MTQEEKQKIDEQLHKLRAILEAGEPIFILRGRMSLRRNACGIGRPGLRANALIRRRSETHGLFQTQWRLGMIRKFQINKHDLKEFMVIVWLCLCAVAIIDYALFLFNIALIYGALPAAIAGWFIGGWTDSFFGRRR